MFSLYTTAILLIAIGGVLYAAYIVRDTLHPFAYLMPMVAYLYVYHPIQLNGRGVLQRYFTIGELESVQLINLSCVAAVALGVFLGGRQLATRAGHQARPTSFPSAELRARLFRLSLVLGVVAVGLHLMSLILAGGFFAAYGRPYGGTWYMGDGYSRDLQLLSVPASALLCMSRAGRRWRAIDIACMAAFLAPWLTQGILAGRRGPTFIAFAAAAAAWYLTRGTRPRPLVLMSGGAGLGVLLLLLVAYRAQVYLGSSLLTDVDQVVEGWRERVRAQQFAGDYGNEFLYGSYIIRRASEDHDHYWGRRYLTYVFVRPIPSAIWPRKYEKVGMAALLVNSGTLGSRGTFGRQNTDIPIGSAPGFAADLFVEFAWGAVVASLALGLLFGATWRRAIVHHGKWIVLYTTLFTFSIFLVMQTIEAFLFRSLVVLIPFGFAWHAVMRRKPRHPRPPARPIPALSNTEQRANRAMPAPVAGL
jgi:hypothetical protein